MEIDKSQNWWKQLEPQWQKAFGIAVFKHNNQPTELELETLLHAEVLRITGPSAPYGGIPFELTNLSGIKELEALSLLIITHHKIEALKDLSKLKNLKSLFLLNNNINDLSGVEELFNLEQLYLQNNQIASIKQVENLLNLKEFYIHDNLITEMDGITEGHSDKLVIFVCRPNSLLKQREIIRVERDLGIICK